MLIKTTPSYNTRQGPIGIDKRSSAISTLPFNLNIANSITDMFYLFYNNTGGNIEISKELMFLSPFEDFQWIF